MDHHVKQFTMRNRAPWEMRHHFKDELDPANAGTGPAIARDIWANVQDLIKRQSMRKIGLV